MKRNLISQNSQRESSLKNWPRSVLKTLNGQSRSKEIVDKILDETKNFSDGTKQHDDITVVVVKVS